MTSVDIEGTHPEGIQVLRMVVDAVNECNLRCLYCHPGEVWRQQHLPLTKIREILHAAEGYGLLELVFSGGEVTLHPEIGDLLDATHVLRRPTVTMITNATQLTDRLIAELARSHVTRIAISIDGLDNSTHGSARGKNLKRVLAGLRAVQGLGREVTIISVAHQGNFRQLTELSRWLADEGLASQHHYCSPSYSGEARENYARLRLNEDDYFVLQEMVDAAFDDLKTRGFHIAFNSFWPVTGRRGTSTDRGRTITLQNLVEQLKDSLVHIRPDGSLRLATASWGRETVGDASIGNVLHQAPVDLIAMADAKLRSNSVCQLPRDVEALHKFQIRDSASVTSHTVELINSDAPPGSFTEMIPVRRLDQFDLLENPFTDDEATYLAREITSRPNDYRLLRHSSGVLLLFNRRRSHVTLLWQCDWTVLAQQLGTAA